LDDHRYQLDTVCFEKNFFLQIELELFTSILNFFYFLRMQITLLRSKINNMHNKSHSINIMLLFFFSSGIETQKLSVINKLGKLLESNNSDVNRRVIPLVRVGYVLRRVATGMVWQLNPMELHWAFDCVRQGKKFVSLIVFNCQTQQLCDWVRPSHYWRFYWFGARSDMIT